MNEEEFGEGFLRFEIYDNYKRTDIFQNHLAGAISALENVNSKIQKNRKLGINNNNRKLIVIHKSDAKFIVNTLTENTGIPFKVEFDDEEFKFIFKEPTCHFDNLPLIDSKLAPSRPEMLSLQFDVTRGINKQLEAAKVKLENHHINSQKEAGKDISKFAFEPMGTTRQSFDNVLDADSFIAKFDELNRTSKLSLKSFSSEIGLNYSTAKSKHQTGTKIIISGQIRKYFPEFRF